MKTILLAAGNSTRTFPISNKNFLEFCDIPLFIHLIQNAIKGGLKDLIIVVQEDNIEDYKKIIQQYNISVDFVIQKKLSQGMAGAILSALSKVEPKEDIFILGGNDLIEKEIYQTIIKSSENADGGILAKHVNQYFPGGYLNVDKNNKITQIIEKPGAGNEPSSLVTIVAHYFKSAANLKKKLFKYKDLNEDYYETKALQEIFKEGNYKAIEYEGSWQTIKYPWHILDMMKSFLDNQKNYISPKADISKNVSLKGANIFISDNVRILENSTIQGPCFIGKNTTIGNNCLVRNSMIGKDCSIGFNTEIARSFLSHSVSTHYAYIGDSVIDGGVNFGAFSCTANLRLDNENIKVEILGDKVDSHCGKLGAFVGKNVQVGIHASLMPGVKLQPGDIVFPGKIVK